MAGAPLVKHSNKILSAVNCRDTSSIDKVHTHTCTSTYE